MKIISICYIFLVFLFFFGFIHQGVSIPQEQFGIKEQLAGLMCFGDIYDIFNTQIICSPYDNSNMTQITNLEMNPAKLEIDQNLGWIYYSTTINWRFSMSRSNFITKKTQKIQFPTDFELNSGSNGPDFNIKTAGEPSYIFFALNTGVLSGPSMIYRSITNGANLIEIAKYEDYIYRVNAIAYSSKLNQLYVVRKVESFPPSLQLVLMDIDGTNLTVIDEHFENADTGYISKIVIDTSEVTSTNLLPNIAYKLHNYRGGIGIHYYDGKTAEKVSVFNGTSNNLVIDFAFDPISKSFVIITEDDSPFKVKSIIKMQLGSIHTRSIVYNNIYINPVSVAITPSDCSQNCNLNGRCVSNKSCECLPGYYPPTCALYCSNSSCVHGTCQKDATCTCNTGWSGPDCSISQYGSPPPFPQRMILKNVTMLYASTNKIYVIHTIYFDESEQMVKTDYANGTTIIDRYDAGFSFRITDGVKCDLVALPDSLPPWKIPQDSIYKGNLDCNLSTQCDVWWSESTQIEYDVAKNNDNVFFPVYQKDLANNIITTYDFSKIDSKTPIDRSVFDYPSSCI